MKRESGDLCLQEAKGKQKPKAKLYQIKAKLYLLCDTLTSSVTLKTPDVTKLSWKPKCPGRQKQKKQKRHKQKTFDKENSKY